MASKKSKCSCSMKHSPKMDCGNPYYEPVIKGPVLASSACKIIKKRSDKAAAQAKKDFLTKVITQVIESGGSMTWTPRTDRFHGRGFSELRLQEHWDLKNLLEFQADLEKLGYTFKIEEKEEVVNFVEVTKTEVEYKKRFLRKPVRKEIELIRYEPVKGQIRTVTVSANCGGSDETKV